ncbi:MAG: DUF6745 domain-containing protein [Candidatus Binatia bacterium]
MSWINRPPKQKKLSAAQMAALPAICEKWNRIGLSTAPVNRGEAERGAAELYQVVELDAPKEFIWLKSFDEAIEFSAAEQGSSHSLPNKIGSFGSFGSDTWNSAMYVFRSTVLHSVEDVIRHSVFSQLPISQLLELASDGSDAQDPFRSLPITLSYGQNDTGWLAFADFFMNVAGIAYLWDPTHLMRIVSSCGFFLPGNSKAAFMERPVAIHLDDRQRPHCVDGPAIQYRDGLTVFALHGIGVPGKYIDTPAEQIDLAEVLQEQNAEVRMAVISKVGFTRLLEAVKPKNQIEQTCPHCAGRFNIVLPDRLPKHKPGAPSKAVVLSTANGNSLVELTIGPSDRNRPHRQSDPEPQRLRLLHLTWQDKTGPKETVIPVPRTKRQFGRDHPENINDCEQVRRWTLGWPKDVEILAET